MKTFYRDIFASFSETMRSNGEEQIKSGQNLGEEVAEKAEEDENERVVQHHEESCRSVSPVRVCTISPLLVFLLSTHLRQTLMRVLLSPPRFIIKQTNLGSVWHPYFSQNVLCPHQVVVKKDIGSLPEKEEWIGSLPEKEEWSGSLPEEEVAFAERLEGTAVLCRRRKRLPLPEEGWKEQRFSAGGRVCSGEKGYQFSARERRVDRFSAGEGRVERFSAGGRGCLCRKVGRNSGSLPEEEEVAFAGGRLEGTTVLYRRKSL
ncbi:hypothetical protein M5K25_012805 [Dendrobium thyrsiflorum]|uniref:Uncharacterized protein n=1 Tax=Dendrobium thyrsiflorum TaxID=117978 RepID=A0ABD0V562_DENTH